MRDQVVRHGPKKQPCERQISHVELYKLLVAKGMYNSRKVSNIKATSQGFRIETNGQELGASGPGTFICSVCGMMFSAKGGCILTTISFSVFGRVQLVLQVLHTVLWLCFSCCCGVQLEVPVR